MVGEAYGVTMDLGAGCGSNVGRFSLDRVTKVYGVERNQDLIHSLQSAAHENWLLGVYTIVPCAIEQDADLESHGIRENTLDSVVCLHVLCSVADPMAVVAKLRRLLKPGGKLIVCEHIRHHWRLPRLLQGCSSRRLPCDTARFLFSPMAAFSSTALF